MDEQTFNNIIRQPITRQAKNSMISKLTGIPAEAIDTLLKKAYKPGTKIFGFTFGSNKKTLANFFLQKHLEHKIDLAKKQLASGYVSPDTQKAINIAQQAQADAKLLIDQQKRNAAIRKLGRSTNPTSTNPTQITRTPSANTIKPTVDYSANRPYPVGYKPLPPTGNTINPTAPRGLKSTGSFSANLANKLGISQKKLNTQVLKGPHQGLNILGYLDKKLFPEESRQSQNPIDTAKAKATKNNIVKTLKINSSPGIGGTIAGSLLYPLGKALMDWGLNKYLKYPIRNAAGRLGIKIEGLLPGINSRREQARINMEKAKQGKLKWTDPN